MTDSSLPSLPLPTGITESYLPSHDLTYHVLSAGQRGNPLILLLHGFPELAFSWRKIMVPISSLSYFVVAYDQRGYGRTQGWDTRPFQEVDLNTFGFARLVGDAVILVHALGYKEVACVIGHDFGAVGSSMCALVRPDMFKSVIMISHPFKGSPTLPFDILSNPPKTSPKSNLHEDLASLPYPRKHYAGYYSTQPAAHEMVEPKSELHKFLRGYFYLKSADWDGNKPGPLKAMVATEMEKLPFYYVMPLKSNMRESVDLLMREEDPKEVESKSSSWLPDADLDIYVEEWSRNGFQGGLNWYRVSTNPGKYMKDVELFAGRKIEVPSLFIAGKQDWGTYQEPGVVEKMGEVCTKFRGVQLVDGAGHWVQQEQPEKVFEIVDRFLKDVKTEAVSY